MAGCGIRAVRWGLESKAPDCVPVQLHVNDADADRRAFLEANLEAAALSAEVSTSPADQLLARAYLGGDFFDLVDVDSFGAPGALLQPVLQVLRFGGILLLASTDGRSPTGHDRRAAIRNLGSAARVHPASWEIALRQQLGLLARQAWLLGRGIQPLLSFSEGRTFRLAVRFHRQLQPLEEQCLGLVARCECCGAQDFQPLLKLTGWPPCYCSEGEGRWSVSGPLWIGPLQDQATLMALLADPWLVQSDAIATSSRRLLLRLVADHGIPPTVWPTAELAKRLGSSGPPPINDLVQALRQKGHQASASGLMGGQIRTDADFPDLLRTCSALSRDRI